MKKYIIIVVTVISYFMVSIFVFCGAYHMYYHHDKQAAIGMVLAFIGMCLCDLLSYLYHRNKEKNNGGNTTTITPT